MHPIYCTRRFLVGLFALTLMVGGRAMAQPVETSSRVIVPVGGAVPVSMKSLKKIKRADIYPLDIVSVEPEVANPVYVKVKGLKAGTAKLFLTDDAENKETFEIIVQADLREILKQAVPTANVEIIPYRGGVVLTGMVARAEDGDTIVKIASSILGIPALGVINALTIGGVQQVQLDVVVARVDRTRSRNRGFNFIVSGNTVQAGSILGGLTSSAGAAAAATTTAGVGITSAAASALPSSTANIVFGIIPAQFQGLLQALTQEGLAKLIASPNLVTQSGRPAHFLSGGQQAIIGPSSGITGPGVVLQPFGTTLDFLPIVYGNGKIYLEVNTEVTAVDSGLGLAASSTLPATPGFDDQSVKTSIVLESGQTFAVGGLIQTTMQASTSRVPVLGEIPFIAPFFSTQTDTLTEQELVILVTPHLVDGMDCNQVPRRVPGLETRAPDDFEFYLETLMEAPRGQRNVFENKCYKGAWKNDPTNKSFPCATFNPNSGVGNHLNGGCATGNCATGNCNATSIAGPVPPTFAGTISGSGSVKAPDNSVPNVKSPSELPPAVRIPMDIPVPPAGR